MKILILEDTPKRIQSFLSQIPGPHDVTFCEMAKDCMHLLLSDKFDWLSLDHDLAPINGVPAGTGGDVAKFLEEHPTLKPRIVTLHSANTVGVQNMKAAIPSAILAPNLWEYIGEVIALLPK